MSQSAYIIRWKSAASYHLIILSLIGSLSLLHLYQRGKGIAEPMLLPDQDQNHLISNPIMAQYRSIYRHQNSLPVSQRRYLIFELEDYELGWGNRIEAISAAFYIALNTSRIFIVRNQQLWQTCFESDPEAPNSYDQHRLDLEGHSHPHLHLSDTRYGTFLNTDWRLWDMQILRNASIVVLDSILTRPVVYATEIWGDEHGFYTGMGQVVSYLTSYPTDTMREAIERARARFNMSDRTEALAVIQMRTMYDDPDNYQRAVQASKQSAFWVCAARALTGLDPDRTEILFTTDEPALNPVAVQVMGQFGHVRVSSGPVIHTADVLPPDQFPDPIADWWLMGQADRLICTGTSFCHTAVWRSRSRAVPHFWILFNLYRESQTICRKIDA